MPFCFASSSTAGKRPISNSNASTSTRVAPRLRHSVMTSSTNSRPTGRLIGPTTTSRAPVLPWKKPDVRQRLGAIGLQDQVAELLLLPCERLLFLLAREPAGDVQVDLALVAAEVQHLEGAEGLVRRPSAPAAPGSAACAWCGCANLPRSVAIHLRPSFSATAAVVPLPQKKSATRSPSLLLALMIRSSSASGFCVG